jgi:DNA-nicking Smr family endonuclease
MAKQRSTDIDGRGRSDGGDPANDDVQAFRSAVRDVKPLPQTPLPPGLVRTIPRARRRKPEALHESLDDAMPLIDPAPIPSGDSGDRRGAAAPSGGTALSFQRAGVQTQVVRRLRRGLFPVEAELDLHGLTQAAARVELVHFLTASRDAGRRCVRIIHGKGYRSGARGPILKIAVDLWLRRHLDVMAFTSARAIDGGTGAVYVLLRA